MRNKCQRLPHAATLLSCLTVGAAAWAEAPEAPVPAAEISIGLEPQANGFREVLDLSGFWDFKLDPGDEGERLGWFRGLEAPRTIAVPGSWNEQFEDAFNYLGPAWYFRRCHVPRGFQGARIFLRVGSANYAARVWINGTLVGSHEGGHLPFAFEVTKLAVPGQPLSVAIRVENELRPDRVPAGNLPPGSGLFSLLGGNPPTTFDFFPYAGLHRAVVLYSVPTSHVDDVTVRTTLEGEAGVVSVRVSQSGSARRGRARVRGEGGEVEGAIEFAGREGQVTLRVPKARPWSPEDPFLYQLSVSLSGPSGAELDRYDLEVGIRTVEVRRAKLLLNGRPVFLKGFGRHEDFPASGRGQNDPLIVKDHALMKWVGANSYRTSHYPYSEADMRLADRAGFLVIDEIPAVSLHFGDGEENVRARLEQCRRQLRELVARDKNHPSVILWSVSNEAMPPRLDIAGGGASRADPESTGFLGELVRLAHELDPSRPATLVAVMGAPAEWLALGDVVCLNRYWGWYVKAGDLQAGGALFEKELDGLEALGKPVVVTEFGADTLPGNHSAAGLMWSEEFQVEFLRTYLDIAARKDFVAGMHVWNFADFRTGQGIIRPGSLNHKGVFTREREPKMAAHFLRERWTSSASQAPAAARPSGKPK